MPFTEYFANKILDYIFSNGELEPPTFEIALFSKEPDSNEYIELRVENYKRVKIEENCWVRLETGKITNQNTITFRQIQRVVQVDAIGLYEYPQGHTILIWKILDIPYLSNKEGNIYINPWDIEISLR